ncbi:MAG: 30S ribosomal protein S9 [Synergistales bacterium]|nr:30S ribosomal protein S9 [Synergistales bacterium]
MAGTERFYWGTGRRKTSIARVRVLPGEGKVYVNDRPAEDYFHTGRWQAHALEPLKVASVEGNVDVFVRAHGGGVSGQSGAVRLGIARALTKMNPELRKPLKKAGLLARDARMVERQKYGLKGARARKQFSKR